MGSVSDSTGFSLIELMVALAIMVIMASLSASFGSLVNRFKLDSASQAIAGTITLARSESIKRGVLVSICRSTTGLACDTSSQDWSVGWAIYTNPNDNSQVDSGEEVIRYNSGLSNTLKMTWDSGNKLTFTPRGRAINSGVFTICVSGERATDIKEVSVSSAGRTRKTSSLGDCI